MSQVKKNTDYLTNPDREKQQQLYKDVKSLHNKIDDLTRLIKEIKK